LTPRPTRSTVGGRAYLDLQDLARRVRRPTDELHQIYALEGFLDRLAGSPHAAKLVLKGGLLLAAYDARRPTRDVDLQGRWMSNDVDRIQQMVCEVAAREIGDGLAFDVDRAAAVTTRDGDVYSGVRVTLASNLSVARLSLMSTSVTRSGPRQGESAFRASWVARSRSPAVPWRWFTRRSWSLPSGVASPTPVGATC
jgi:hypothetical protein